MILVNERKVGQPRKRAGDRWRQLPERDDARRRRRRRRWIGALLIGGPVVVLAVAAALWLIVHHVPGWYEPVYVPHARLDEVRAEAVRSYGAFGDSVARRRTFTFTLDERRVNEWIAARERIWPESGTWLPAWVADPMIAFRDGRLIVAARLDRGGHQLIASAGLTVDVGQDDILVVRLERLAAGSMPVPIGVLARPLARLLQLEGQDLDLVPAPVADAARYFRDSEPLAALSKGVRRANRFIWANGRRPYRIQTIEFTDGKLTLTVEPL